MERKVLNSASELAFAVSLAQTGERTLEQRGKFQSSEGGAASVPRNGVRLMGYSRHHPLGAESPDRVEGSILEG